MRTLPPPAKPSVVLSFDFDGTLHSSAEEPPVPIDFFEQIRRLRETSGAVWGINTGRSMPQLVEGMIESRFPFLPDWVIAREREIYFPNEFGRWLPHADWNHRCEKEIHRLFKHTRKLMKHIRREVEDHTGARWIETDGDPAGIIAQSDDEMEWIVARILPMVADEPHLGWQRNSIYLRFGHRCYQKGTSLTKVASLYSLAASHCFAIGDSHNDVEMLDPEHSSMAACPDNSVPAIKEKILERGGYVTPSPHGHGAVEALKHFFPSTSRIRARD